MPKLKTRVAYGAALLDRLDMDWAQRIDLDRLDLAEEEDCVAGQLNDSDWASEVCVSPYDAMFGFALSVNEDYSEDYSPKAYKKLTKLWKKEIKKRL